MSTPPVVVCSSMLKDTIAALAESQGVTVYKISKYLAEHKANPTGSNRPDRMNSTVRRVLDDPENASWENVRLVLAALGVDAEAAIAIAASQVKPKECE